MGMEISIGNYSNELFLPSENLIMYEECGSKVIALEALESGSLLQAKSI